MTPEQSERDRLQHALARFFADAKASGSIRSVNQWAVAAGLSTSTINPVIKGTANKRLADETYFKLAVGASKLMQRPVTADELKGEAESAATDDLERRFLNLFRSLPEKQKLAELRALEARLSPDAEE